MKPKDFKKIIKKLTKGGFELKEKLKDHHYFSLYKDGVLILWFKRSQSLKDYQKSFIAHNLRMSDTDLGKFIQCSLSVDNYIEILKDKSIWPVNLQ